MIKDYNLQKISAVLSEGGTILYPTDTIWGIGCDATNYNAVQKVIEIKQRKNHDGFIIFVDSIQMLKQYVEEVHPKIETLMAYHTQPLTVIYKKGINLPDNVTAKNGSIAIRIPQDTFCKELIQYFGKPIVSTSANISSEPYPVNFGTVSSEIFTKIDHVVKHRQYEKTINQPSVLVELNEKAEMVFVRQ